MIDIVCRFSNKTAFFNRLRALSIGIKSDSPDWDGMEEHIISRVNTPASADLDTGGNYYMSIRMPELDVAKIPNNDQNPAFTVIWRSDDDPLQPWPTYTQQLYDEYGDPSGTVSRKVTMFAGSNYT